jgi:hypothetical protein
MKFNDTLPAARDNGRIRLGGFMRLPGSSNDTARAAPPVLVADEPVRVAVSDSGRIRFGGFMRLPART